MKRLFIFGILALMLTSCADTVELNNCTHMVEPGGFWWGLWNGMTAGWAWLGSLISDGIAIYDVNNNGGWYDFGFVLGIGAFAALMKSIATIITGGESQKL